MLKINLQRKRSSDAGKRKVTSREMRKLKFALAKNPLATSKTIYLSKLELIVDVEKHAAISLMTLLKIQNLYHDLHLPSSTRQRVDYPVPLGSEVIGIQGLGPEVISMQCVIYV